MSVIVHDRESLRAEIDRRRRLLLNGFDKPKVTLSQTREETIAVAEGSDVEAYSRLRLSCCEFSPIDLDLHAAQILLDVQRIHVQTHEGPAAPPSRAEAASPARR